MDNSDLSEKCAEDNPLPRWVKWAFPLGIGPRRGRVRDFWVYTSMGIFMGILLGLRAFLSNGTWHTYRWWLIGYFAVVALALLWEWKAIRWLDQSKRWPD